MTFVKVNPRTRSKNSFANHAFNHLINDLLHSSVGNVVKDNHVNNYPAVNVTEGKDDFRLDIAIPGLSKKDIEISIDKNILTISADKKIEAQEGESYTRKEFSFNKFKRTFKLNDKIDTTKINAAYKNGILSLTLSKKEEAKELPARSIEIK